jgi:hypothetical protein
MAFRMVFQKWLGLQVVRAPHFKKWPDASRNTRASGEKVMPHVKQDKEGEHTSHVDQAARHP